MRKFLTIVALFLGVILLGGFRSGMPLTKVAYTASSASFPNPERGWWKYLTTNNLNLVDVNGTPNTAGWAVLAANSVTLTRSPVRLDSFRAAPLTQAYLDAITTAFAAARSNGAKVILRFVYNVGPAGQPDATRAQILSHLGQLAPVLATNVDVIAFVEAGFIGMWGEWHDSTNGLDQPNWTDRQTILDAILAAVPSSRMVVLRYPWDLRQLHGVPITPAESFSGSNRARVGHHNDCFVSSGFDTGTYQFSIDNKSLEAEKAYLSQNAIYTPTGGETCALSPPRSDCATALRELEQMHWTSIGQDFDITVLAAWTSQGCISAIDLSLGYRIRLNYGYFPTTIVRGSSFRLTLSLVNVGWGAIYNVRPVYAVLKSGANVYPFLLSTDPRRWSPKAASLVDESFTLSAVMPTGSYSLYLWLPDAAVGLQGDRRYAIQLANVGVWDGTDPGYNLLGTVTVN